MSDEQQESPATVTVRMDGDLVNLARIVCAHTPGRGGKQLKLVDYLDGLVRQQIIADHARIMAQIAETQKKGQAPPKTRRPGN